MSYLNLIGSLEDEAPETVVPAQTEDEIAVAEDAFKELDEIRQSIESMNESLESEGATVPAYARKMVADRLTHLNGRTGLPVNSEALEAFMEGNHADLHADVSRKQNKLRTFIAKRQAAPEEA